MRLSISHSTTYRYHEPVPYGLLELRLTPHTGAGQTVKEWRTTVDGARSQVVFDDQYRNRVELVRVDPGSVETVIVAAGEVETTDLGGVIPRHSGFAPLWLFLRSTPQTAPGPGVESLVSGLDDGRDDIVRMHELAARIRELVAYEVGGSTTDSTVEEVLESRRGVCQDHAHLFVAAARSMGVPARYVSGYLKLDDRIDQDASHAWAEAWIEGLGWLGLDVSNGISPDERYVRVASGLDYGQAAPISGVRYGSGTADLHVTVQVQQ